MKNRWKNAAAIIAFIIRHFLAVSLAILAAWVIWTLTYALLLLYAICFNQGLGSPLTYPLGLMGIGTACSIVGWGLFTPSAALGRLFCWLTNWPLITAIPIVCLSAFTLTYLISTIFSLGFTPQTNPSITVILKNFTLYLSIPLGAYWWLTEGSSAVLDAFRRWIRNRRSTPPIALK